MRVLVGYETSGVLRDAFIAAGHEALSCDYLPTEREGPHHQGALQDVLNDGWDLAIFFLPYGHANTARALLAAPVKKIALESCPAVGIRKPDQIIQPWWFGENSCLETYLWLKGLPKLKPTEIVPPKGWSLVRYACEMEECQGCGEPWCELHGSHYADCDCIGPTEDEVVYRESGGFEFGTRETPAPRMLWGRWSGQAQGVANAMVKQWGVTSA